MLPEFAFIGRSNVGKSSLLNLISGKKDLAKVSSTPGHTRLINFFTMNQKWSLVDLPGYGYAKVGKEDRWKYQEMVAEFLAGRGNLACIFVLIDSRLPPQKIDTEFLQWLVEAKRRFALVFTKTDKLKPSQVEANIQLFKQTMALWYEETPDILTSSAKTKSGLHEVLAFIARLIKP